MGIVSLTSNQRNLSAGPYTLTVEGKDLWPFQYFLYDMIKRRLTLSHLSKTTPDVQLSSNKLLWEPAIADWTRVFSNGRFTVSDITQMLEPFIAENDFQSEDRLLSVKNSQDRFRVGYLVINGTKSNPELFIISKNVSQEEFDRILTPRENLDYRRRPLGQRDYNCAKISIKALAKIERRLAEQPHPILLNYQIGSVIFDDSETLFPTRPYTLEELAHSWQESRKLLAKRRKDLFSLPETYNDLKRLENL